MRARREGYYGYARIRVGSAPEFVTFSNGDWYRPGAPGQKLAWEQYSLEVWTALVRTATAVIDVGASVGIYTLSAAALRADVPIHAFEPNPDAFARLVVNLVANGFENSVVAHREGASDTAGFFELAWLTRQVGHLSGGGSIYTHAGAEHYTKVPCRMIRLDDALAPIELGPRPIVKIDVEGQEGKVFAGMQSLLARRPDIILETFMPKVCSHLTEMTKPLGYRYFKIFEDGRLIEQEKLAPADKENMNQLMSVHEPPV